MVFFLSLEIVSLCLDPWILVSATFSLNTFLPNKWHKNSRSVLFWGSKQKETNSIKTKTKKTSLDLKAQHLQKVCFSFSTFWFSRGLKVAIAPRDGEKQIRQMLEQMGSSSMQMPYRDFRTSHKFSGVWFWMAEPVFSWSFLVSLKKRLIKMCGMCFCSKGIFQFSQDLLYWRRQSSMTINLSGTTAFTSKQGQQDKKCIHTRISYSKHIQWYLV